ncbi:MAG: hypothetical protein HY757_08135 [Nitrospirae bacterium]|nr:hypothetical protein [Nitrospirota bacterium]
MYRLLIIISPIVLIITLLFNTITPAEEVKPNSCLSCHEDVFIKAASYRYRHSVVTEQCPLCHISPETKDNIIALRNLPTLQREWLIYFDQLSNDQGYQAEIVLTDSNGKSCAPDHIDIVKKNIWEPDRQRASLELKKLFRVAVDEIQKRGFVRATISWDTDVPATSDIEYGLRGERPGTFKINDLYTRNHKIILNGLKHKSTYYFRTVSRDIYGNTLRSEEHTLDTSGEFTRPTELKGDDAALPVVEHMQVFRMPGNKGLYLKVSANKLSEISVKIKEIKNISKNHGVGLTAARYSRIDICYKCHSHDSSHPVGIKAVSPKTKTPDGLPTIEDGIITCVTCHEPHGGERVHYNRFDFKQDLCMRCHLQKYSI